MPRQQLDEPGYVVVDGNRLSFGDVAGDELVPVEACDLINAMLARPVDVPVRLRVDVVPWPADSRDAWADDTRSLDEFVRVPAVMMWAPYRVLVGHQSVDGLVELSVDHVKRMVLPEDGLGADRRRQVTHDLFDAGLLH